MKIVIFYLVFFVSSLLFVQKSFSIEQQFSITQIVECDYWSEIIYIGDSFWLFEYCGDKLISMSPIDDID